MVFCLEVCRIKIWWKDERSGVYLHRVNASSYECKPYLSSGKKDTRVGQKDYLYNSLEKDLYIMYSTDIHRLRTRSWKVVRSSFCRQL